MLFLNSLVLLAFLLFFGANAFAGMLASGGTLVVIVPSRQGLVIAADSRSSIGSTYCDNSFKIIEAGRPARTAITVTGKGLFIAVSGPGISDLCEYVARAHRSLDIGKVVSDYLNRENTDIAQLQIEDLALRCIAAVRVFQASSPLSLRPFVGRELFTVVLAGYDLKLKAATVRSFIVRLTDSLEPEFTRATTVIMSHENKRDVLAFGETDYLSARVYGGMGRQFLNPDTIQFIMQDKTVAETDLQQTVTVVTNVIDAASKTTTLIPAPSGIGGPIDVLLLGKNPRPQRLRWKSRKN